MNVIAFKTLFLTAFLVMSSIPALAAKMRVQCTGSSPVAVMYEATYPEDPMSYIDPDSEHFDILLDEDQPLYFGEWVEATCPNPGNWGCGLPPTFESRMNLRLLRGRILKSENGHDVEISEGRANIRDHSCILDVL